MPLLLFERGGTVHAGCATRCERDPWLRERSVTHGDYQDGEMAPKTMSGTTMTTLKSDMTLHLSRQRQMPVRALNLDRWRGKGQEERRTLLSCPECRLLIRVEFGHFGQKVGQPLRSW